MNDALQLAVLSGAMVVAGLAAMVRRGPITPRPDWPPSPTWSSRRDKLFSVTSALLLGLGVVFATLSMLAIVLTSLNTQA